MFYKKVDAIQFKLTPEDLQNIRDRKHVYFEGGRVKHVGGDQFIALLQRGENLMKVHLSQWLVKHPDGQLQILWPDQFAANFIKATEAGTNTANNPFTQPNTII